MIYGTLLIISFVGFVLAWYASYVEQYAGKKKGFQPLCDISAKVSCTKVFSSSYGKHLGISNAVWGMFFYALIIILTLAHEFTYIFIFSIIAFIGSLYLAYILYAKVRTFCIVCASIYLINILLLIVSYSLAF